MNELPRTMHDDRNGLDYILVGDYYIPALTVTDEERPIGRWGQMHADYLKENRSGRYNSLLMSGKLWTYLADLNEQAEERFDCIVSQMQKAENVNEQLKAEQQLCWVQKMNSIRNRAEEIIRSEMIYI
jgi:hypothetical protein